MQLRSSAFVLGLLLFPGGIGCSEPSDGSLPGTQSGGSPTAAGNGGTSSGGVSADTGGTATGGSSNLGAGGFLSASGGAATDSGGSGAGGDTVATGGFGGSPSGGQSSSGGASMEATGGNTAGTGGETSLEEFASGLDEFFLHDACTGVQAQSDTCTHVQRIERRISFGGDPTATYTVGVRVRGLFEPTHLTGATTPMAEHPYFVVGGTVQAADYSQWQIEIEEPHEVYTLNHYPETSHTIYQEDFEAELVIAGGAEVIVRVVDANDRQIDNGTEGLPDRRQLIEGVTDEVLDGQMLRLDVLSVTPQK